MKNAIIIVNYNKKELLQKCLQSLFLSDTTDFHVFVVDNGSKDGSITMLRDDFAHVTTIEMGYNSGFCKANNVGIQKAIDDGCENIILLNNDTEVDEKFISELAGGVNGEKRIDMVAPKILMHADRNTIDSAGLVITPDGMAINRLLDKKSENANEECEVFCPTGAAALFSARLLTDIKQNGMYFDEAYEYYLEDLDMGWRARLRGWKCMYTPQSVVYHHKNATSGGHSKFIAFHTNRNNYYNIVKNYSGLFFCKALFLAFMKYPYLIILAFNKKGVADRFSKNVSFKDLFIVTIIGMKDIIVNLPNLCKKRRFIQGRRIEKDFADWFQMYGISFFESKK